MQLIDTLKKSEKKTSHQNDSNYIKTKTQKTTKNKKNKT